MNRSLKPIQTNPKLDGIGLVHGRSGDLTASISCYRKVLSINKNEPRAKANLLTIYKKRGEFEKHIINKFSNKEDHQQPDVLKAIADLLISEGENVEASHHLAVLAKAIQTEPNTG